MSATLLPDAPAAESGAFPMAAQDAAATERHAVVFSGEAGEFFRIWIVNTILSLLTLGIYSAWAKVRTQRYFYGHTRIAGAAFDYSAQPLPILKGRLIGATLFAAYALTAQFAPVWNLVVVLLIFALMPWIVVRGLAFRARYSSWRGLNFRFVGSYRGSYAVFLGLLLLTPFTLGLLFPYTKARQHQFVAENHRYGNRAFSFMPPFPSYFALYLGTAVVVIVGMFLMTTVTFSVVAWGGGEQAARSWLVYVVMGGMYLLYFAAFVFLHATVTNLLWNNLRLDGLRFESKLSAGQLGWLYLSNAVAILASIGLLIPWAMVRTARYRAACLTLLAAEPLDRFIADSQAHQTAIGAEIGDAFDIDIGL